MSVANDGTQVLFAAVEREAWTSMGTVPFVRERRYQGNITTRTGNRGLAFSRSGTAVLAVPPPALTLRPLHRMTATESGESLALNVAHPQAAPPIELHALRLGAGEQGVRHESVIAEHREVVAPHPASLLLAVPA